MQAFFISVFCIFSAQCLATSVKSDTLSSIIRKRTAIVSGVAVGTTAVMYVGLGTIWYHSTGRFHWFNDLPQWRQMDKAGHTFSAFHLSAAMIDGLKWAGASRKNVLLWGGLAGLLIMSPIEILDGFSPDYGASASDLAFNATGAALAFANEALWQERRFTLKYSFFPGDYAARAPALLGKTFPQQAIKDYNAMTFWATTSFGAWRNKSVSKTNKRWLNCVGIAFGYGADGMVGGYGKESAAVIDAREYRQFYIGLDLDLEQIPTRKKWVKAIFRAANLVRLPLPALEINERFVRFHPVYF